MRYTALACDGDGTLMRRGRLAHRTSAALERFRAAGGKVILVTGEVHHDFSPLADTGLFDCISGENGAVLYCPRDGDVESLAARPPTALVRALKKAVHPLNVGRVVLSTGRENAAAMENVLAANGGSWRATSNRKDVMALPQGVNKATGLEAALKKVGISPRRVVGVGDAENDIPLLRACGLGVAVADAVPIVKEHADLVMACRGPSGVIELIGRILAEDLPPPHSWRHV
jgi:hydroxymethylpyrimidine pyrophosphatase-like HAD family hydrolase